MRAGFLVMGFVGGMGSAPCRSYAFHVAACGNPPLFDAQGGASLWSCIAHVWGCILDPPVYLPSAVHVPLRHLVLSALHMFGAMI
jgi:hypothetical protein